MRSTLTVVIYHFPSKHFIIRILHVVITYYYYFRLERSTDQVIKPINIEALSKWVGHLPSDVIEEMDQIAPMLKKLGYDPAGNPPNYGEPDSLVRSNMDELSKNKANWINKEEQVKDTRNKLREKIMSSSSAQKKSGDAAASK